MPFAHVRTRARARIYIRMCVFSRPQRRNWNHLLHLNFSFLIFFSFLICIFIIIIISLLLFIFTCFAMLLQCVDLMSHIHTISNLLLLFCLNQSSKISIISFIATLCVNVCVFYLWVCMVCFYLSIFFFHIYIPILSFPSSFIHSFVHSFHSIF